MADQRESRLKRAINPMPESMRILKSPLVGNVLRILAVPFFGFILWNFAFVLFALFVRLALLFFPTDFARTSSWFMTSMLIIFSVLLVALSWFVFRSILPDLFKAIYATMPLAVMFVSIGILTYPQPVLAYGLNGLAFVAILAYLVKTKQPWIYYYALGFTASTLLIFTLLGGEI
ncbi:MAG: hypothetical protein ABH838_02185 [Actinomycetota bacterium]